MRWRRFSALVFIGVWGGVCLASAGAATAARPPAQPRPVRPALALLRLEPLGLDAARAIRLETLFRLELERLVGTPLPGRQALEQALAREPGLRNCGGEPDCLARIGRRLGVKQIVSGNLGELGDSYIVNLKLVDAASAIEVRRISRPLRGRPDELIEAVRVAAYELIAPNELKGSLAILSDVAGANVLLDGRKVGRTPLAGPVAGLKVGAHKLRLEAQGFAPFTRQVEVHFQKEAQVEVRMLRASEVGPRAVDSRPRPAPVPWYSSNWTYAAVGVTAIVLGVVVGRALAQGGDVVVCSEQPEACAPR